MAARAYWRWRLTPQLARVRTPRGKPFGRMGPPKWGDGPAERHLFWPHMEKLLPLTAAKSARYQKLPFCMNKNHYPYESIKTIFWLQIMKKKKYWTYLNKFNFYSTGIQLTRADRFWKDDISYYIFKWEKDR
jgi:hypothetical protein